MPQKTIAGLLFISFTHFILIVLSTIIEGQSLQMITRFLGGSFAIYFLFLAKNPFSRLLSLFSFLLNTCYLFILNHSGVPDLPLIPICLCTSFIFSFFFIETRRLEKALTHCFIIILSWRFFVSPDIWFLSFLVEMLVLVTFRSSYMNRQDRKSVSFSLIVLLFLCYHSQTTSVLNSHDLLEILVLAAAGAGSIQFMFLSKTERGATLGLALFLINNGILGFLLRKDGETLPMVTVWFLVSILCFYIGLYLISKIKEESFYYVLSEVKSTLRGVFIPVLLWLNHLFLADAYDLWITSLVTRLIVIQLLQLILKKEDENPDQDKEIKSGDVRKCKIKECRP